MILVDMIADRNLTIRRDTNSTAWLTDIIWSTARRLQQPAFMQDSTRVEDDHLPFLAAGVPSVDIIDLDYPQWHTAGDTLDAVSARSLQIGRRRPARVAARDREPRDEMSASPLSSVYRRADPASTFPTLLHARAASANISTVLHSPRCFCGRRIA